MKDTISSRIYSEVPLLDRVQRITEVMWRILFSNNISRFLWDMVYMVIVAVIFTRELRLQAGSALISIILFVTVVIAFFIWGYILTQFIIPKLSRVIFGPPVFGKIGGLPRKTFFTTLKLIDAIGFEFRPEDQDRVKEFSRLDREVTELSLRQNYRAVLQNDSDTIEEPADFLEKWSGIWQETMLNVGTRNSMGKTITFGDSLAEDNFASRIEPLKLQVVSNLVSPTLIAFQIVLIYFIDKFLSNQINLVTVIQVGLFFSLIVSLLLFNFHAHQNTEIPIIGILPTVPEEVAKSLADRLESIGSQPFRPSNVTIKKDYLTLIRGYFATILFWSGGVLNACTSLLLLGLILLVGFILQPANISEVLPWYKDMALGLSLIPFGMLAGYYVAFLTLQHARVLAAPIIVGLLAAVLPYTLGYLFTGQLDLTQIQNSIWAAGAGIVASLVTVITSQVKSTLEQEKGK